MTSDIDIDVLKRPPEDADDWDRAMTLAENLAQSDHIGERQAQVYAAADIYDIERDDILGRLDISDSNYYQTLYDARDNIEDAEWIESVLADPPREPRTVTEPTPVEEWSPWMDDIDSNVRHDPTEDLTGELYRHDIDDGAEPVAVKITQQTGGVSDRGASAYVLQKLLHDGTVGERYVAPVDWIVEAIGSGVLKPATLRIEVE